MKIIASDYDGTLNHGGIDDKKREAIKKWRDAGNVLRLSAEEAQPMPL